MRSLLQRAVFLTFLSNTLFFGNASATTTTDWANKCSSFGAIQPKTNPSFQHINCLLTNAALAAKIPPEVVKAVASQESDWRQFDEYGKPFNTNGGIGIMQLTNQLSYDQESLKNDIVSNIQAGVEVLNQKYNRTDLPKVKGASRDIIENWYFPVMAYNGTVQQNSPLYKATGARNKEAYQEKVFAYIEEQSLLNDLKNNAPVLGQFPFTTGDFEYNDITANIRFLKNEYVLNGPMHSTAYLFKTNDKVIVPEEGVRLRIEPSTEQTEIMKLSKNTTLVINGPFLFDQNSNSNRFVWYPVKTDDGQTEGYISSAYIKKMVTPPTINPVDDHTRTISGTAEANTKVIALADGTRVGEALAENGVYTIAIPLQKAGTIISVYAVNQEGTTSTSNTVTVMDKTPPSAPTVKSVADNASIVTGTAETDATIFAKVGNKQIGVATAENGRYTIKIPKQKAGTTISVYAVDLAGNFSKSSTVKVTDKTPPGIPAVNKITTKSKAVTGKAEIGATITIYNGNKQIGKAAVDSRGNFKVSIKAQKKGSLIKVYAGDKAGNKSKAKTITVS